MHKAIISDSTCLITLYEVGRLELLHDVYQQLIITPTVGREIRFPIPDWINVISPSDLAKVAEFERWVDPGEASSLALALELAGSTIILDDLKARKLAERLGLDITGTVGVLLRAKRDGILAEIGPLLTEMRATTDFYISDALQLEALSIAGELRA